MVNPYPNTNANANNRQYQQPADLVKLPYEEYPAAAELLLEDGAASRPTQNLKDLHWATGIDIVYTLKGMTPAKFREYSDTLLMLALQECNRYKQAGLGEFFFAGFDVRLGRLKKGRDLPEEPTFQTAMHPRPEIMVYGEEELGYEVPQKYFLNNKVSDILDIARRYGDSINKQTPYRVLRLFISIRTRKPQYRPGEGAVTGL